MWKAVLFDLDGTLLDSQKDIYAALGQALSDCRIPYTLETLGHLKGAHLSLVLAHFKGVDVSDLVKNELDDFSEKYRFYYMANMFNTTAPFPGVVDTLKKLPLIAKAVATSKPMQYASRLLDHFELRQYFKVVQGCETLPPKPDPAVFMEAAKALALKAEECLVVGDTELDIIAGTNAGCKTCLANYSAEELNMDGYKPDYVITRFDALIDLIDVR